MIPLQHDFLISASYHKKLTGKSTPDDVERALTNIPAADNIISFNFAPMSLTRLYRTEFNNAQLKETKVADDLSFQEYLHFWRVALEPVANSVAKQQNVTGNRKDDFLGNMESRSK